MKAHTFGDFQLALTDYQEAEYQAMLEGSTYYHNQEANEIIQSYLEENYLPSTY